MCDKSYANVACLHDHVSTMKHIVEKQNQFPCKECVKSYGSRKSLNNHVNKTHKQETIVRKHQCSAIDCKKSYDLIESLNDHKRKKHKIFKWK